ncbi:MAG TPA: lytic transglycosylase domain-containing protein [Pyrinomonadaceae bacterium]|nr:lytic transglycosylase domain-containing protein [Pyrinomonadaceae bacterium]
MGIFQKLNIKIIFSVFFLLIFASANSTFGQNNWVADIANQEGVHPTLVFAVMKQESSFRPGTISPKGAIGLMQLMPDTARRFNVNPYNMQENVRGGCRYLRFLLIKFGGRLDLALAGYNAGENAVIKYGYNVPPYQETQNYVYKILNSLNIRFGQSKQNLNAPLAQKQESNNSDKSEKAVGKEKSFKQTSSSFLF